MNRCHVCFFSFLFLQTSSIAHSRRVDRICVTGNESGAFSSPSIALYLHAQKSIYTSHVFPIRLLVFSLYRLILCSFIYIYIGNDKEEERFFASHTPKFLTITRAQSNKNNNSSENEQNEEREREKELLLMKKMMKKACDKKKDE